MQLLYERTFHVHSYEVDHQGRLKPAALMNYMQEIGRLHSTALNLTVEGLHRQGKTWVMAQFRIAFTARPSVDAVLRMETWPSKRDEWEVVRDFEVTGGGAPIARASASYVIIDLASRRPVRVGDLVPANYQLDRAVFAEPARPIARPGATDSSFTLPVLVRDLDVNMHVNNVVYAQWALDTVPLETWNTHELESLEIAFRSEIRPGTTVTVSRVSSGAGEMIHQIQVLSPPAEAARIRTVWKSRG